MHWFYISVTLMSWLCHIMSHWCHANVTLMSLWCHTDVTLMWHLYHTDAMLMSNYVTLMSWSCHTYITLLSCICQTYVTLMSHWYHTYITFVLLYHYIIPANYKFIFNMNISSEDDEYLTGMNKFGLRLGIVVVVRDGSNTRLVKLWKKQQFWVAWPYREQKTLLKPYFTFW